MRFILMSIATFTFNLSNLAVSQAETQPGFLYSTAIAELQKQYGTKAASYPIVIFDQDEIEWRFLQKRAFGESNKGQRLEIIQDYIKEKTGFALTTDQADQFEPYLNSLKGEASAVPIFSDFNTYKYSICGVFTASPNSNQRIEIERNLQLLTKSIYGDLDYQQIQPLLSYEELALFSLYHELAHCLDTTFAPRAVMSIEDPHSSHQSESFAETMAYLLLTKNGYEDLEQKRGLLRTIYSYKMGRYFPQHPQGGFGNPNYLHGGAIYYLAPALRAAAESLTFGGYRIEDMSLNDMLKFAHKIVLEHALDSRSFTAISQFLKDGSNQDTVEQYRQKALESSTFYYRPYSQLLQYVDFSKALIQNAIGPAVTPRLYVSLRPFSKSEFCHLTKPDKKNVFLEELNQYRIDLQTTDAPPQEQRERAKVLNYLFLELDKTCPRP